METKKKVMIGATVAALGIVISTFALWKYLKGRQIRFIEGDDDDVVYVLLDGEKYEDGKNYKFSSRKKAM